MILSESTDDPRVSLQWKGPFKLGEFIECESLREHFNKPGVYLHLYVGEEVAKLWYIGRSNSSLSKRQKEHCLLTIGGLYNMPKEHKAMQNGEDWNPDHLKNKEMRDICLNQKQFIDHVKTTFSFAETIEVYLAECSKDQVNDVEGTLLLKLHPCGTIKWTKSGSRRVLKIDHASSPWTRREVVDKKGRIVCDP